MGQNFFPTSLNNNGQVVGNDLSNNGYEWSAETGTTMLRSSSIYFTGIPIGIDDAGHIIGVGAAYWADAGSTPIVLGTYGTPPNSNNATGTYSSAVSAISWAGFIVGQTGFNYDFPVPSTFDPPGVDAIALSQYNSPAPYSWPFEGIWYSQRGFDLNYYANGAGGSGNWVGAADFVNAVTGVPTDCPIMDGFLYQNLSNINLTSINANNVAAGTDSGTATLYFGSPYSSTNLTPGVATYLNDLSPPQVIGNDFSAPPVMMLWDTNAPNGQAPTGTATTATYTGKQINLLINQPAGGSWNVTNVAGINNAGAIVGTATASGSAPTTSVGGTSYLNSVLDPADTFVTPAVGAHGVLLLPLQLKLLNGSTPDFDGTIPTAVIPSPENPAYTHDVAVAGGFTNLGVAPMGQGRAGQTNDVYAVQTLVAAQAPASMSGIQYEWKRYLTRRSWYIQKVTTGSVVSYHVTQRTARGTTTPADDTGSSLSYNTTPSPVKHEFYFHDTSALGYEGGPNDTNGTMPVGSYILEKKAFTYQVNISFDGLNWTPGANLPVEQIITVKYVATGGTAATDWVGVPNLQGGNAFTYGTVVPVITPADVQNITGSTNFTIDPTANN